MGMNIAELVNQLIEIGPYDQPPTPDTDDETPTPREKEDIEDSAIIKPKLPKEVEFQEENDLWEEEEDLEEELIKKEDLEKEPIEAEDPEEEPIEEDDPEEEPLEKENPEEEPVGE